MATWSDLERELSIWHAAGVTPTFWWRDDDAESPSPALDTLLALAQRHSVPIHLAVVPKSVGPALANRLSHATDTYVLQHGFAHVNNEPQGARASEVGEHRDINLQLRDLKDGWQRLVQAQIPNLLPGFAAPWNRIADKTVAHFPNLGYRLLSTCHARKSPSPVAGVTQVNIHFDPIRWKQGPKFRGTEATLEGVVEHLVQRRTGLVDKTEPTGLSTHHLQTDDTVWSFTDQLLERLTHNGASEWIRLSSFLDQK